MTSDEKHDYSRWSNEELNKAEVTATRFLEQNRVQIADTLRAKLQFIDTLIHRLNSRKTTLDQRLDCFARIAEISQLLKEDADGFFQLASQPLVARILSNVKTRKPGSR